MSMKSEDVKWFSYTSSTQTMRTWARLLQSEDEIPDVFQSSFPTYNGNFPYTLFIPEERRTLFSKRNKRLVCLLADEIVLLEAVRNHIKTFSVPFADVLYLEHGKILLNSWLKIVSAKDCVFLSFNTTNEPLFLPVVERVRQPMGDSSSSDLGSKTDQPGQLKLDELSTKNYKYMSYAKSSVRPSDTVIDLVYQPPRDLQEFRLFKRTLFRRQTTDHLSILTEDELILVKEDKRIKRARESRYGGVLMYLQRHQIQEIRFVPDPENSVCLMKINFPGDIQITSEFSLENPEVEKLRQVLS